MTMKCSNCGEPIEWYNVIGRSGFWIHPDLVDYDNHGTMCADDSGEQAEPWLAPPRRGELYQRFLTDSYVSYLAPTWYSGWAVKHLAMSSPQAATDLVVFQTTSDRERITQ